MTPAPAAAGKKYKKCCGLIKDLVEVTPDKFFYYNQLLSTIKAKLNKYYSDQIKQNRKDSQNQFVRYTVEKSLPAEHDTLFSDWLWFDKTDINGNTPCLNYLRENANLIEKPLLECLESLNSSYLSVYEAGNIKDYKLEITDIFSHAKHQVLLKDPNEIEVNNQKLILLGRLINIKETAVFSGIVLIMKDDSKEKVFLQEHLDYMQELYTLPLTDILKQNGEKVYGLFDHAFKKTLMNLNDIRVVKIDGELNFQDKFNQKNSFEFIHTAEGFNWYKPKGETRGYVRTVIGNKYIILCADVLEDVLKHQEMIRGFADKPDIQIISSLLLQKPPAAETADLWYLILKDQETERWLNTPHIELNNQTPLDILHQENGREQLLQLLDDFAAVAPGSEETELIEYMKMRIQ